MELTLQGFKFLSELQSDFTITFDRDQKPIGHFHTEKSVSFALSNSCISHAWSLKSRVSMMPHLCLRNDLLIEIHLPYWILHFLTSSSINNHQETKFGTHPWWLKQGSRNSTSANCYRESQCPFLKNIWNLSIIFHTQKKSCALRTSSVWPRPQIPAHEKYNNWRNLKWKCSSFEQWKGK